MTASVLVLLLAWFAGTAANATTTGGLEEAISLYHAAQYQEALSILDGLSAADAGAEAGGGEVVAEYRALCLLALGRGDDARAIVQALVKDRPGYRPSHEELPPRYLAMVDETRSRLWPSLVKAEYRAGKVSYERKAYPEAAEHFRKVTVMLGEDSGVAPEVRETLAEIGDLARDFLALSERGAADGTPAGGARGTGAVPELPGPAPARASHEATPASGAATGTASGTVYSSESPGVAPPVAVRQDLPQWRAEGDEGRLLRGAARGLLAVVIDTSGHVESAQLEAPIHPLYDARLLARAKEWVYRPASREGVPVRYRKLIDVRLVAPPSGQIPEWP